MVHTGGAAPRGPAAPDRSAGRGERRSGCPGPACRRGALGSGRWLATGAPPPAPAPRAAVSAWQLALQPLPGRVPPQAFPRAPCAAA